jgi:hypothetical protein
VYQIYVDGIIFGSTDQKSCEEFSRLMVQKFEMSMMGELTFFLGFQIKSSSKASSSFKQSTCKTSSRSLG